MLPLALSAESDQVQRVAAVRAAVKSMVTCAQASLDALGHRRIEAHHSDLKDFQFVIIEHGERVLRLLDLLDRQLAD